MAQFLRPLHKSWGFEEGSHNNAEIVSSEQTDRNVSFLFSVALHTLTYYLKHMLNFTMKTKVISQTTPGYSPFVLMGFIPRRTSQQKSGLEQEVKLQQQKPSQRSLLELSLELTRMRTQSLLISYTEMFFLHIFVFGKAMEWNYEMCSLVC